MSKNLYVSHRQIADALGTSEARLRAARGFTRANIAVINPCSTRRGRSPTMYHLGEVIEWLSTVCDVHTPKVELVLRNAARPV